MKQKDYIKAVLAQAQSPIKTFHKTPVTRRDLFAQGYLSMGAMVMAPGILSMVSTEAKGETGCKSLGAAAENGMIPFLCVDLGGGANVPGANVIVGDRGGQLSFLPPGSYASLGLAPEAEPGNVSIETALGLGFHPESRIFQGIMAGMTPETAAKIDGGVFCTASDDDTQNNPHNPTYWIAKSGAQGKVVSIVGTNDSVSGGRAAAPEESIDPASRPALVRSGDDAIGLVVPGLMSELVGKKGIEQIMKWTEGMSRSQLKRFNAKSLQEQTRELLSCVFPGALGQVTKFSAQQLDPSTDESITTVFDMNDNNERRAASIAKVLLDGYAGSGTITMGGYDYHGNPRTTTDPRDLQAGTMIGKFFQSAALKGVPAVVYCFTDGGVGCRADNPDAATPGRFNPSSDSGQRSAAFMLAYNPGLERTPLRVAGRRQIGSFKPSGGVDLDTGLTSNSVVNLTKAAVANYLALHGKEGELEAAIGRSPFGAELEQYLLFNKITG